MFGDFGGQEERTRRDHEVPRACQAPRSLQGGRRVAGHRGNTHAVFDEGFR